MTVPARLAALVLLAIPACAPGAAQGPVEAIRGLVDPARSGDRAAVELAVKDSFPAILAEIDAGGGPALTRAYDAAGVPAGDRSARTLQLSGDLGLYADNPAALSLAIQSFGRA
ncbi:hypothetical protein [Wenxinia marina]|uniref:Uncharacterized protein n=1 Tax=Wenxinia marina DSM 24838 TaxID=1123501 RepID=A0A0D0Q5I7_9RHOB|nr:hypothetical protein [Wenxinia marina]KIQ67752.1 hypothetical protein Wenmar_03711 [Wenxinia marina DSM 24838]GGL77519.1 hypothetical protein GCM10011392_34950 [Wenxinia marina]